MIFLTLYRIRASSLGFFGSMLPTIGIPEPKTTECCYRPNQETEFHHLILLCLQGYGPSAHPAATLLGESMRSLPHPALICKLQIIPSFGRAVEGTCGDVWDGVEKVRVPRATSGPDDRMALQAVIRPDDGS
jgi:hypothetical protein